jgi:hypothetical protein
MVFCIGRCDCIASVTWLPATPAQHAVMPVIGFLDSRAHSRSASSRQPPRRSGSRGCGFPHHGLANAWLRADARGRDGSVGQINLLLLSLGSRDTHDRNAPLTHGDAEIARRRDGGIREELATGNE